MISSASFDRYEPDGVVYPIPVLSPDEVAAFRDRAEELLKGGSAAVRQPHRQHRWAYDLCAHSRVLDAVEALLGPDLVVHSTLIFFKRAGDASFVSWHQDGLYPGLQAPRLTTAWIALTSSVPENGCLRVIPGSHKWGIRPHKEIVAKDNLLNRGQTMEDIDESQAVDISLKPGEMSLHHRDLAHASKGNHSDMDRIGYVIRCITPEARVEGHPVAPVRGDKAVDHFEILTPPNRP